MLDVIWDMDGVLLDTEPIYLKAESGIAKRYGKDIYTVLHKLLGRRAPDSARIVINDLELPLTMEAYLAERNAQLLAEMPSCGILPGVFDVVRHLKSVGARCAIATSSPADLLAAKRTGKDEFFALFDAVICGDDVENGKPDPEIFLKAAKAIGADPANCVVFEDAPAGLRAARLAGMKSVALPNHRVDIALYMDEKPTIVVPSANMLDFDVTSLGFPAMPAKEVPAEQAA